MEHRLRPTPQIDSSSQQEEFAPTPITNEVLELTGLCQLGCKDCHVTNIRDKGVSKYAKAELLTTRTMAPDTAKWAAKRLAEHGPQTIPKRISLHGGEPSLLTPNQLAAVLTPVREHLPSAEIIMDTNGVDLSAAKLDVLRNFDVKVAVSLDGDTWGNRHRVYPADRSGKQRESLDKVLSTIDLLKQPQYKDMWRGLQWTLPYYTKSEITQGEVLDTEEILEKIQDSYKFLTDLMPPRLGIILPHANHINPPYDVNDYGKMMVKIFDLWWDGNKETGIEALKVAMHMPFFDSIISSLMGRASYNEAIGLDPLNFISVDPSGNYRLSEALPYAHLGADVTGLNVREHTLDEILKLEFVKKRQMGAVALSQTCQECNIVKICGGGLYGHGWDGESFDNPSVYSEALRMIIEHIAVRIRKYEGIAKGQFAL